MTAPIWRQVIGVSLWNFLIILTLYIGGPYIAGIESFDYYGAKITAAVPDGVGEKCDMKY